ncbi:Rap1a/Tai family immunity protein [Pelagibius sp. CAU 1746]|uniref:Rap1a/Tai family immunity protein n=1 Tax=Pelagibius sp. CAU 1746 TaxID=3140370 RepID=UPI00325A7B87
MTDCRNRFAPFVLGLLLCAGLSAPARSADPLFAHEQPRYRSGAELLEDCKSAEPADRARCAGYVMAVADMLGGASARIDGLQACLKGDETVEELLDVVRRHLEVNPARAVLKGDGAVAYALSIYRPCADSEATFEERLREGVSPER